MSSHRPAGLQDGVSASSGSIQAASIVGFVQIAAKDLAPPDKDVSDLLRRASREYPAPADFRDDQFRIGRAQTDRADARLA